MQYEIQDVLDAHVMRHLRSLIASHVIEKMMIYCTSMRSMKQYDRQLNCLVYHATFSIKNETLQQFLDFHHLVIVITNALDLELNVLNVRLVMHLDLPRTLLEYAQESGRDGRDDRPCRVIIVRRHLHLSSSVDLWLAQYLFGLDDIVLCRRITLNCYLDGSTRRTQCDPGESPCDVCTARPPVMPPPAPEDLESSAAANPEPVGRQVSVDPHVQALRLARRRTLDQRQQEGLRHEHELALFDKLHEKCLLCWTASRITHAPHQCLHSSRPAYHSLLQFIQRIIKYDKFAGCFECGMPQSVCDRWEKNPRGGSRRIKDSCQYPTLLYEGVAWFF